MSQGWCAIRVAKGKVNKDTVLHGKDQDNKNDFGGYMFNLGFTLICSIFSYFTVFHSACRVYHCVCLVFGVAL